MSTLQVDKGTSAILAPRCFTTVLHRDQWLWHAIGTIDVGRDEALDQRLERLPDDVAQPKGRDWLAYAMAAAVEVEAKQRWAEAQAYWSAACWALAQDNVISGVDFEAAAAGLVRSGIRDVGVLPDDLSLNLWDLLERGLSSPVDSIRSRAMWGLLALGEIDPSIYDNAQLDKSSRMGFSEAVTAVPVLARAVAGRKGSHEQFRVAVSARVRVLQTVRQTFDRIAGGMSLDDLLKRREDLLKALAELASVAPTQADQQLIEGCRTVCRLHLANYESYLPDVSDEVWNDFDSVSVALIGRALEVSSPISACILTPLIVTAREVVSAHYRGVVTSHFASLRLTALKPAASPSEDSLRLHLEIFNDGNAPAEDCDLHITRIMPAGIEILDKEDVYLGHIGENRPHLVSFDVRAPISHSAIEVTCHVEWKDRSGPQSITQAVKFERQREMAWAELEARPTPYTILSVSDPERLKGRDTQVRNLQRGLLDGNSFLITGQKRVGKTSLAKVVLTTLRDQPQVLAFRIPIGELPASSSDDLGRLGRDFVTRLAEEFEDRFGREPGLEIASIEAFRDSFNAELTGYIRRLIRREKLKLVLALDDLDELPVHLFTGPGGDALFLAFRALIDRGVCLVFIGSERLPAILKEQAQRMNQMKTIEVDYLQRPALTALVTDPSAGYLEFQDKAIGDIYSWSAGNPYYATQICAAIWDRAVQNHDYVVVGQDVAAVIRQLMEEAEISSYQHFWSDSRHASDDARTLYETKSLDVILSLSRHQPTPAAFADRSHVTADCANLSSEEADQHVDQLLLRKVILSRRNDSRWIRCRVPMFSGWLQARGAVELRSAEHGRQRLELFARRREELAAEEVEEVAGMVYRDSEITSDKLRVWLSQFGELDDQRLMLKLVRHVRESGYYPHDKFMRALVTLHSRVVDVAAGKNSGGKRFALQVDGRGRVKNLFVTHMDVSGKSGSATVKQYRSANGVSESQSGSPEKVIEALKLSPFKHAILVCVDDFVGTGGSAREGIMTRILAPLEEAVPNWRDRTLVVCAPVLAFESGLEYLRSELEPTVHVVASRSLDSSDQAFTKESSAFETADERLRAREIAHRYGCQLEKKWPLGYENSEALIVFPDNVPNNSLPILYKQGKLTNGQDWVPLFPRN